MNKTIIRLRDVWKIYEMGNIKVNALRGLTLDVYEGEFLSIMGPSGSGKCVDGKTKIMLSNGSLISIEDLYKQKKLGIDILCFDFKKGRVVSSAITGYHRRKSDVLDIRTSSGRTINSTKEHPFFSISGDGLSEVTAENLDTKYVAVPREIKLGGEPGQSLNTLDKLFSEKDIFIAGSKSLFRKLTFNKNIRKKICTSLNIKVKRYDAWMNSNDIPLKEFNHIINLLGKKISEFEKDIIYLKQSNTKNKVKVPYKVSEFLMEAYGYIAGDGWIDKDAVRVSNTDKNLKQRISYVFKKVFEVKSNECVNGRLDFCSTTLKHFFKNVFEIPKKKKSRNITLPSFINKCSRGELASFIRALFDCDGYVQKSKNEIIITLASKAFITALIPVFLRFGIVARYSEVTKRATNSKMKPRKYFSLSISGLKNLVKFNEEIGFVSPHKLKRLKSHIRLTKKADTNVDIVPCTKLIRNTRRSLKISLKRIKKRCGKDFWQLEGTSRKPTLETVEFILEIFKNRLNELKNLKPSFKLTKDLGFSRNEFKTTIEIKAHIKEIINCSSVLINELEQICKISRYVFWDKIKSVAGKRSNIFVYDLTIRKHHNFIANNFIVHNSTCVNMVGCLDIPTKGSIHLDGKNIAKLAESELAQIRGRKIGFIFQQFNLIPTLSALENVTLPMIFQGTSMEERVERAKELLTMVGLGDRMQHKPTELSGGQQQRVAIARSLANNPDVVLADEPTGNLDSRTGKTVMDFLGNLNRKEGKTIIMVTHDKGVAEHADRVEFLKDGAIVKSKERIRKMQRHYLHGKSNEVK